MKLDPQFAAAIQEIETTRGIPRDRIVDALRQGFEAAYEKNFGSASNLEVEVNLRTGVIEAYLTKTVVEDVQDENEEISLAEAREVEEGAEIGDSLGFEADMTSLGNLAIHTFKQKLKSLIKDAERDKVMRLYGDRIFEMINCTVLFVERGDVYVETPDKVEGIIAYKEQIPRERLNPGQRVKCLLTEVRNVRKALHSFRRVLFPNRKRIAPSICAWAAIYARTDSACASIVWLLVMKHTSPPGRTRSSARPKK